MYSSSTMNQDPFAQFKTQASGQKPGLLAKVISLLLAAGIVVLGFMFSLVALVIVAVFGLGLAVWFWWKTRAIRKLIREQQPMDDAGVSRSAAQAGDIIEGEAVREHDTASTETRLLK